MKVNQSEFIISAVRPEQYPEDGLPEIALAGRSNVGEIFPDQPIDQS